MAPVALYPDQLLAQMLLSATTPARVTDLDTWLKTNPPFKGTALQDAAKQTGFEPSLVMSSWSPSRGLHGGQPRLDDRPARHSQATVPP